MFMIRNFLKSQVRLHVCNFWLGFHMQDVSRMDFPNGCTYAPSQRASTILQCASWGWQHQICCRRLVYLLNLAFRDRGNRALARFYKKEKKWNKNKMLTQPCIYMFANTKEFCTTIFMDFMSCSILASIIKMGISSFVLWGFLYHRLKWTFLADLFLANISLQNISQFEFLYFFSRTIRPYSNW